MAVGRSPIRWEVSQHFDGDIEAVLASPATLVKDSPAKRVTRHATPWGEFFIKRYLHEAVAGRPWKYCFKRSQAGNEWQVAQRLEALQVPIVEHVALGQRWSGTGLQESILVTRSFPGLPLNQVPGLDLTQVVRFIGQLHQKGVLQRDLHPENVLADPATGELRLVDLHGIKVCSHLSEDQRRDNLAYLRIFLPLPVAAEVVTRSRQLRKIAYAERARRCLKRNREFTRLEASGLIWQVRSGPQGVSLEQVQAVLSAPDAFLEKASPLKKGRSATVSAGEGWVLKRYNFKKWSNLVKDCFRLSKGSRSYLKAYHLELAGIPTARALATADRRWAGFVRQSYFLMEQLEGEDLQSLLVGSSLDGGLARAAGELLGRLHEEGFSHRDLKATNVICGPENRLSLIDLDGLEYCGEVPPARARADLERFCRGVLEVAPQSAGLKRGFWRGYMGARQSRR